MVTSTYNVYVLLGSRPGWAIVELLLFSRGVQMSVHARIPAGLRRAQPSHLAGQQASCAMLFRRKHANLQTRRVSNALVSLHTRELVCCTMHRAAAAAAKRGSKVYVNLC